MRLKKIVISVLALFALSTLLLSQQQNTVSIHGTVRDATGKSLSGVRVEAINEADSSEGAWAITDNTGNYSINLTVTAQSPELPNEFRLLQNYPNPFNPSTLIRLQIPQASEVRLDIYNTLGQKIRTVLNRQLSQGSYTVEWDATNDAGVGVAAGIYFYQLHTNPSTSSGKAYVQTRKMVLLDGGGGRQTGAAIRPKISSKAPKEPNNLEIIIRASSPHIAPFKKQVKVTSPSVEVDISVDKSIFYFTYFNRDNIIASEPSDNGKVYVSGLAGAVNYPVTITDTLLITVTNLRTEEQNSGMVSSVGGFSPITVGAVIEDRLMLSLNDNNEQSLGASLYLEVLDNIAPHVDWSKPTNGDKDIIVDGVIIVQFSEPINTSTVNQTSFVLTDSVGTSVPGEITFDNENTTAILDPTDPLAYDASYTITVTTDVEDLQGLHLANIYTATFTTQAQPIQGKVINVPGDFPTIQAAIEFAADGDTVLVADGTFIENINFKGKAISVASHFIINGDTSHISNTIIDGSQPSNPDSGSVVYYVSGEDTNSVLSGFTIRGGMGTRQGMWRSGGGVFCMSVSAKIVNNHIIENRISDGNAEGGGVFFSGNNGFLILEGNQILRNRVTASSGRGEGGAVKIRGDSAYTRVVDNVFEQDSVVAHSFAGGGAVHIDGAQLVSGIIQGNIFRENIVDATTGNGVGAGLALVRSEAEVRDNLFEGNIAKSRDSWGLGGAIHIEDTQAGAYDRKMVIDNRFISNLAKSLLARGMGGALHLDGTLVTISGNYFERNAAQGGNARGGALRSFDSGFRLENNLFFENNSSLYAGAVYISGTPTSATDKSIINNTFVNNMAPLQSGGIIMDNNGQAVVVNSILWGNTPDQIAVAGGASIEVRHSDIQSGWAGIGNIDADPLFADTTDYKLSGSSPCIGTGIDSMEVGGVWYHSPPMDMGENPRPDPPGSTPDMGAWESPF